jgi:hypothetical protein
MTAALYFVQVAHPSQRQQCPTLNDAYRLAWKLLQDGILVVDVFQHKLTADCWGPATGRDELLHHLAPAVHPIAPTGGHGSTATFPPYVWRMLHEAPPPVDPDPPAPPAPEEFQQGTLFG